MILGDDTITIEVAGTKTEGNREVADWDNLARVITVDGCSVQPGAATIDRNHRDAGRIDYTIFAPAGTTIAPQNRVRIPQEPGQFVLTGAAGKWTTGGPLDHVPVYISRWIE